MLELPDNNTSITKIILYLVLYLFLIFIAQAWIATFLELYRQNVIRKEQPTVLDLFTMSLIFTTAFIIFVWIIHPTLPLFK